MLKSSLKRFETISGHFLIVSVETLALFILSIMAYGCASVRVYNDSTENPERDYFISFLTNH